MSLHKHSIALLLVLLLVFPLAGQSLHVLVHPHHHHSWHGEFSEGIEYAELPESCPVCAYEFVLVSLPPGMSHDVFIRTLDDRPLRVLPPSFRTFSGSLLSPRAPPVIG